MKLINKNTARKVARLRRDSIPVQDRNGAGTKAALWFLKNISLERYSIISAYWPLPTEFDCRPLLYTLLNQGHRMALPAVIRQTGSLCFRRWRPSDNLAKGRFGVFEPISNAEEIKPKVVITPFLAINPQGFRLGYGGGYYDRALRTLRETTPNLLTVGLGFSAQEVASVPYDINDEPLDWLVTEQGTRRFQG